MHNPSNPERHVESPIAQSNFSHREKLVGVMTFIAIGAIACSAIVLQNEDNEAEIKSSLERSAEDTIYSYDGIGVFGIEVIDADTGQPSEHKLAQILLNDGSFCIIDYTTQRLSVSTQDAIETAVIGSYGDCPIR